VIQAEKVARMLVERAGVDDFELLTVSTTGDTRSDVPISAIGGQGAFVKEVQAAVIDGRADLAVHSLKDLPPGSTPGLVLAAVPERDDVRDALVLAAVPERDDVRDALVLSDVPERDDVRDEVVVADPRSFDRSRQYHPSPLDVLSPAALVATGSVRRQAQLAHLRPDLRFAELRGNIATRLGKVPPGGAAVVAMAALARLGLIEGRAVVPLDVDLVLPQVGQGALGVESREGDDEVLELVSSIDDPKLHRCVEAERAFLEALAGGCDTPVGALGQWTDAASPGRIYLEAMVATGDGRILVRHSIFGHDPVALGREMAEWMAEEAGMDPARWTAI
jgi:hydroxymethylbilane synthase